MKCAHNILVFVVAAYCFRSVAADDAFYQRFLRDSDTNNPSSLKSRLGSLLSPMLVDTNNTAAKMPNVVVNLEKLTQRGEFADLRLGMTMDEIVARWGKPTWLHPRCDGGHRFRFRDCTLVFRGNSLHKVRFEESAVFDHGLLAISKREDWVHALGPPTQRNDGAYCSLVYEKRGAIRAVLLLTFTPDGEMVAPPTVYLNPDITNWFKPMQQ